jgi:hypothetical protein
MNYKKYTEYVAEGNDPNRIPSDRPLRGWVRTMRNSKKNGRLAEEKIIMLEKLGLKWEVRPIDDEKWDEHFSEVKEYMEKTGERRLRLSHPLYYWWKNQLSSIEIPPVKARHKKILSLNPEVNKRVWSAKEKKIVQENPHMSILELQAMLPWRKAENIQAFRDKYGW